MSRSTETGQTGTASVVFGVLADTLEHTVLDLTPLKSAIENFSMLFTTTLDQAVKITLYGYVYKGATAVQIAQATQAIGNGTTQVHMANDGSATLVTIAGSAVSSNTGTWSLPKSFLGGFKVTATCSVAPSVGSSKVDYGYHG